jgi:cytochrome c oxidase subunit 1
VFGGIYHWFPKIHRPHARRPASASCHFWVTFLGTYLIYFPMHYLGVLAWPRALLPLRNYSSSHPARRTRMNVVHHGGRR